MKRFQKKIQKSYYKLRVKVKLRFTRNTKLQVLLRKPLFKWGVVTLAIAVVAGTLIWLPQTGRATPQLLSLTGSDMLAGTSTYSTIKLSSDNQSIRLQDGVVGAWNANATTGLQNLPTLIDGISNLEFGPNNSLYLMSSFNRQCTFHRYDIERKSWHDLATPPVGCGAGNTLSFNRVGSFYYTPGGNTSSPSNKFFRYDISNDTWVRLADFPSGISNLSSAAYAAQGANRYLYIFRGLSSPSFWRYNINTNTWENMSSFPTTGNVSNGVQTAWDGANSIYALANNTGEFKRFDINTGSWTNLNTAPGWGAYRGQIIYANGKIYAPVNQTNNERAYFYNYDIAAQSWSELPSPPTPANDYDYPLNAAYDGSRYLYTIIGTDIRPELVRFDMTNNTWNHPSVLTTSANNTDWHQTMIFDGTRYAYTFGGTWSSSVNNIYQFDTTTDETVQTGSQVTTNSGNNGVYSGGRLYLMPISGTLFQSYDPLANTYITLADLPYSRNNGADIVDGGDGYLYTTFGGRSQFYRYSIALNTWFSRSSMPNNINEGGNIVRINRSIYVLSGGSTSYFLRYDMDANTWTSLNSTPNGSVSHGGFMVGDATRYLYISTSTRIDATTQKMYRYDTQTDTWLRIADLPASVKPYASGFYKTSTNQLFVSPSREYSMIWNWSPGSAAYVQEGNWYSKSYDLKQVQTWTALNASITGGGSATLYTRTSPDGRIWNDWVAATGTTINSPVNRYIEIKATLQGDGTATPTVRDISIAYNQETTAPTMPSNFTAYGEKGGEIVSTGQTYEYQHPYFEWAGASDGASGSGVEGYYVYFGLNSNADPAVNGAYQTTANYTVSTPMTAGEVYYLRIKVKDKLGNTSGAATFFSYRYFYISPPNSVIKTSDADFSAGANTNVSIANGAMTLPSSPNGSWGTGPVLTPPSVTSGGAMAVVDESIYVVRGSGTTTFWRYDTKNQLWSNLSNIPEAANSGSSLAYVEETNTLYLMVGNNSIGFYSYDILNDSWSPVERQLPSFAQRGSDITYIGTGKFAILFTGVREFYEYDIATSTYRPLQSQPTTTLRSGSGLWYNGVDKIYAYLGASYWYSERNSRTVFAEYTISTDTWKPLATPPVTAHYTENNLVTDGQGNLYIFASNRDNNLGTNARMMRYSIAEDTWHEVRGMYGQVVDGSAASDGERYIYVLPDGVGTSSRKLIRYDSWNNSFSPNEKSIDVMDRVAYDEPANAWPWVAGNSLTSTYDGKQYVYAINGDERSSGWNQFLKYDPETGETIYLPATLSVGVGGSMVYIDEAIYYMPARNTRLLYKFEESSQQWIRMADAPGNLYRPGSSAMSVIDGELYITAGNNSNLYKYTPNANDGTWQTLSAAPGRILYGATAYDESTRTLYILAGDSSTRFYGYSVDSNTWSTLSSIPLSTNYGTMTISNGKIYAYRGNATTSGFVYDIASNSWSNGIDAPDVIRHGSRMLKINEQHAFVMTGEDNPEVWQFNYPSSSTSFESLSIHESEPIVIAGIFDYAGITAQATIPENTRVELWTRSSPDGNSWEEWRIASEIKKSSTAVNGIVNSTPQRYTQVRIVLESDDNLYTPSVSDYTISYYFDIDPPENPSTLITYSNEAKTAELSNNTWYNHVRPVFDWPEPGQASGATDGPIGSNIAGYWVYLGTDPSASPRTQGIFVEATEYQPTLTQPGTYYLRMQAQDITGNVDGDIYAPFIYKFDNQPPTNPALVTVTPSGFTTNNNFSYAWPNAFDGHSGVAGYCFLTGATTGPFAAEVCQAGTSLSNVSTAYRSGTNVFYVRAYDTAGNFTPSYTSTSYYYSTDPPGPVTNLRAIPPTSTANLFAFTWDLPAVYSGDPDQMSYCYSINVLPSAINTTCTDDRFISAFKAATQEGTNIIYVVAQDEAGNANWTSFASANFIANTVSPGIPLNLVVTDTSDRETDRWSLTLTWDKPTFEGNGISDYIVERSADSHTYEPIGNTSTRAFVDLEIEPEVTYHYRVRAQDDVKNIGGASATISRAAQGNFAEPPATVVPPAATTGFDQSKITWVTGREATSFVYYGTSPSNLDQSKGSLVLSANHAETLTGLFPSTTYYYRVQSFDEKRSYNLSESYSEIYSFRTTAAAQIDGVGVSDVTSNSAVISWSTSVPTKTRVSYGPTQGYGLSAENESNSYATRHTIRLTELSGGTNYHFRINSTTEFGSSLQSDDYSFDTIARPIISNVRFQPVTDEPTAGVEVVWETNVPTSSTVRYSAFGTSLEETSSALATRHRIKLKQLASNTEYEFTLSGRDQYGNLTTSAVQKWSSTIDTRPPEISESSYSVSVSSTGDAKKAQLIVSWTTDEPATSQMRYGSVESETLENASPSDAQPTTNHVVVISGLDLANVYAVQIVTRDLDGNTELGPRTTIVTPDQEVSVFDSILNLMVRLFRF